jgi:ribosomal protein S18 acetylase RimI-like enzyme
MNIHYRKLTQADSKDYRTIRLECLKEHPENFGTTYKEESSKPKLAFESYLEQPSAGTFQMGAYVEKQLIGICGVLREMQEKRRHRGTVVQMYVKSAYSGKGIGRHLLVAVVEEAFLIPEIEQLDLALVANNKGAKITYERVGFREYGYQQNYFKDGDRYSDQIFMVLFRKEYIASGLSSLLT